MKTSFSAVGDTMGKRKSIFRTKALPVVLLVYRKYQYDIYTFIVSIKSLQRTHQYRLSLYRDKLLGYISPHA